MLNNNLFKITALALAISLSACGGGGSDGYYNNNGSSNGSGTDTGGETSTAELNVSTIQVFNQDGIATQTVSTAGVTAKVKVTDASGSPVGGALVTFSGDGVTFGTSNGSVLSNADGEASISIRPADSTDTGSYAISATASLDSLTANSSPYYLTLQAANITIANMTAVSTSLKSGGSTNITMKTQDASSGANQNNITVNFSTSCGSFDTDSVVSSNQGDVTTTYNAVSASGSLCEGAQTITATTSDGTDTKNVSVNIAAITANALVYTTADAVNLVTKNSGSAASGQIEFTVYANGNEASNQKVSIEIVKGPSDLSLDSDSQLKTLELTSDTNGRVTVDLYPGTLPGPVEVKASLVANTNVTVLSKNVAVATGRAYQSGLSLSMSKNALQNDVDGDTATVVARLADRVGNPVPNGTVVSFVTEGGSITPSCATTNGQCSVILSTQNPRPIDNRVSLLAYVEGDKAYSDNDGSNSFTSEDTLINNIGDLYRDDNENRTFDKGEFVYRRGSTGACTPALSSTVFTQPNIADTCDQNLDAVLRHQMVVSFSEDTPTFDEVDIDDSALTFYMYGNSELSVPMPTGTTVSGSATDNTKDNELSCSIEHREGSELLGLFNFLTPSGFKGTSQVYYRYAFKECARGDTAVITVTAPNGKVTKLDVSIP
ncbi:Ig-like domain-containing protein [Acinetobacter sp. A3.8]|uniref:Ig-like domain-containing protein n=1 Tax=Acinetobacter sedimenti TaxID=2919922 RepID=A0A9X1WVP9_9GAMM|nr:Ig-like domain-containing protein [Acinetobacter sedimenti]MCJ8146059.1 Ig-like domain-containing protein [Acinetobacter sedimenti]